MFAGQFPHANGGFERRAAQPIVDAGRGVAQIQEARRLRALRQQAREAAAQQGGLGQIRFAFLGPQQKNGGRIGEIGERGVEIR